MVFRQFNEATGPRLAPPTAICPCRNRFAPTWATGWSRIPIVAPPGTADHAAVDGETATGHAGDGTTPQPRPPPHRNVPPASGHASSR